MTASPLHTSISAEHYTPISIVEPSRLALGGRIDLDPASSARAQEAVKAEVWRGEEPGTIGALAYEWHGGVFLNPPGGKLDKKTLLPLKSGNGLSSAGVWWCKLWNEWNEGNVHSAIFICFSLNVFRASIAASPVARGPHEFPFVIPRKRIQYDHINEAGERVRGKKCQHDSAIVYLPNCSRYETEFGAIEDAQRFKTAFEHLGPVRL